MATGDFEALPPPWELILEEEDDPALVEEFGWHPQGVFEGYTLRVFPSASDAIYVALHELGHAVDDRCFHVGHRGQWIKHRDNLEPPWYADDPYTSPAEDWADSFAVCFGGDPSQWTQAGSPPDSGGCDKVRELVTR